MAPAERDHHPVRRGNVVPSGCVLVTTLVILAVAVAGYYGYRYLAGALDVPEELETFTAVDSVQARIRNRAGAPGPATRLDSHWVRFYVDALDTTGHALLGARDVIDSLYRSARSRGDTGLTALLTSPRFYRAITLVGPTTKRSLVAYLNAHGRSLAEYEWAKMRVLAASDITEESADSTLKLMLGEYFDAGVGGKVSFGGHGIERWFERIDSLRASGSITEEEQALVAPYRSRILERGLASLYGLDTEYSN